MALEIRAYQRLFDHYGTHENFVKLVSYDEKDLTITMENMVNGTLRAYLEANNDRICQDQRHRWVYALAECVQLLHSANIVHGDLTPRNMLLDGNLQLKVADFGCVSMDGSGSSAGGDARFYPPDKLSLRQIEAQDDLFALGSSIFEILTSKPPYPDLETDGVREAYTRDQFPDLFGLDMGEVISDCWHFRARSAKEVHQRVMAMQNP